MFGAGIAIFSVISNLASSYQTAAEKAQEAKEQFEALDAEIQSLNSELSANQQRMADLLGMGHLSFVDKLELSNLQNANKYLEEQIRLKQKLADIPSKTAATETLESLSSHSEKIAWGIGEDNLGKAYTINNNDDPERQVTKLDAVQSRLDAIQDYYYIIDGLEKKRDASDPDTKLYTFYQTQIDNRKKEIEGWQEYIATTMTSLGDLMDDQGNAIDPANQEMVAAVEQYHAMMEQYTALFPNEISRLQNTITSILSKKNYQTVAADIISSLQSGQSFEEAFSSILNKTDIQKEMDRFGITFQDMKDYFKILTIDMEKSIPEKRSDIVSKLYNDRNIDVAPIGSASIFSSAKDPLLEYLLSTSDENIQIIYDIVASGKTNKYLEYHKLNQELSSMKTIAHQSPTGTYHVLSVLGMI